MYQQDGDSSLDTLRAAIDRIIPADDFPGAWDAGVGDYIRRQLAGDLRHLAPLMDAGLASLDAEARTVAGYLFAALPPDGQDRLLADVERGVVSTSWPISPEEFFATLVRLTAEGYYGDPGNGGNREAVSWRMVGYDPRLPQEVPPWRETQREVVAPEMRSPDVPRQQAPEQQEVP